MKQHCENCSCGKLKNGDEYWFVGNNGIVYKEIFSGDSLDTERLAFGNVFKKEADAIEARDAVKKLLLKLKK